MATVPVIMGSRGRIRVQPTRRLIGELAATINGDQEDADDIRHF